MFATECLIGRCDCGVLGCGDVRVKVSLEGELVVWSAVQGTRGPVSFRLGQYLAEVERALVDHSWETPERAVSRHIRTGVDHQRLARSGMKFSWASGRAAAGAITIALCLEPGPYQVLVRIPWDGSGDAAVVARSAIALLAEAPSSWPRVDWIAQRKGLGAPMIAGPGWRPWKSWLDQFTLAVRRPTPVCRRRVPRIRSDRAAETWYVMRTKLLTSLAIFVGLLPLAATADHGCIEEKPHGEKIERKEHLPRNWLMLSGKVVSDIILHAELRTRYKKAYRSSSDGTGGFLCLHTGG